MDQDSIKTKRVKKKDKKKGKTDKFGKYNTKAVRAKIDKSLQDRSAQPNAWIAPGLVV